ncbi:uncharacterized protein LOC123924852 isoform X3 [Trifolium pratense]|uniref:uncharacterized protein LOC123924852 isoform X3 n=1 Tax=Trifolium pratense TaxID=57577 RepID=UPI001E6905BE|nr:uncharacterized protein LOC123924852 isoform X3 [Trifolium pratense]
MSSSSYSFDMAVECAVKSAVREDQDYYTDDTFKKDSISDDSQPRPRSPNDYGLPTISENERHTMPTNSTELKLSECDLENRRKNGAIYDEVSAFWTTINERLKFLSKKHGELSIDEAIEIIDASKLLSLSKEHKHHNILSKLNIGYSVRTILQGQMLVKKGRKLLALSKSTLQKAYI